MEETYQALCKEITDDKLFFVDKYSVGSTCSPFECEKFDSRVYNYIDSIKNLYDFPHLLIEGIPGSGKSTLAKYILKKIYGLKINNLCERPYLSKKETKSKVVKKTDTNSKKKDGNSVYESPCHIEIDMRINSKNDKYLTQKMIIEYASTVPLNINEIPFRIVLIYGGENISYYSQTALRATIEKYSEHLRFIILTNDSSQILSPIKSRLHTIKIIPPTNKKLSIYLMKIAMVEGIFITDDQINEIIFLSKKNIKNCLWMLNISKYTNSEKNTTNSKSIELSYDRVITKITELLCSNEKLNNYEKIEELMYVIMTTNINETSILEDILIKIIYSTKIDEVRKRKIVSLTSETERKIKKSNRKIIQLNEYTLKMFQILRK